VETEVLRILDANLNRAREALRVIEDHARFACEDADAAERVKHARHGLRQIVETIGANELLAARDIVNDVGRDVKTLAELQRGSTDDVVRAAFARLTEAARVLGEYGKLAARDAADAAEKLRYQTYELEQCIVLRATLRARFRAVRLYVILTEALCKHGWYETAEAALRAGADCLQLREKDLPDGELLARAARLRRLTEEHNALLAINDRPDIARLCAADIVHVGQEDMPVADARRIARANLLVGKSTHTPGQFDAAAAENPDYLAVGPMFASTTKPQAHIAGPETLRQVAGRTELPLVGIGGITTDNAGDVIAAGAGCICVCSAVIAADDPAQAAASFLTKMTQET
jgi:thiamine-phosphate pyrophosphorylase